MLSLPNIDPRGVIHVHYDRDGHYKGYRVEIPVERMTADELAETLDEMRAVWPVPSERPVRVRESLRRVKREVCARCVKEQAA